MAEQSRFPQRKKNFLDDRRLALSAPTPGVKGKFANLNWGYFGNLARLTVWTNDPEDQNSKDGGKIGVTMPAQVFQQVLELLKMAIALPEGTEDKWYIECKEYTWFGGKRSEQPEVIGTVWVGRNKDGECWISVVSPKKERPRVQFKIGQTFYNHLYHGDGTPFTNAEASTLATKAYINMLEVAVPTIGVATYEEKKKEDNGGGNRGGQGGGNRNWNNNRSNEGGGGRSGGGSGWQDDSGSDDGGDADIPF
jgi:uncharacterized membrane protein YgcG